MHTTHTEPQAPLDYIKRPDVTPRTTSGQRTKGLAAASIIAGAVMFAYVMYRTRQAERDHPPMGDFIEVDGVRLHYSERGQGQPVVLLHGNGTMIQDFETSGLIDLASDRYRVIAFDRPGYGYSTRPRGGRSWSAEAQADLLYKALRRLGVDDPIVLGHSWGTLVAVSLALGEPNYVRGLVLLSGYYYPTARVDVPLLSPPAIPIVGDIMRYTISPILGRILWPGLLRLMFGPPAVPSDFARFPVWMALRPKQVHASAAESAQMVPSVYALRRRYRDLTMPVVIMAGADDRFVGVSAHSVRLHDELPRSDLRLVEGAGHMVHHVVPNEVVSAIDWIAEAGTSGVHDRMPPTVTRDAPSTYVGVAQVDRAATAPV